MEEEEDKKEEEERRNQKDKGSVWDLWDTIQKPHMPTLGAHESVERMNGWEYLFSEIITENFPNLEKGRDIQIQEVHRTHETHDQKRSSSHYIVVKLSTIKYD